MAYQPVDVEEHPSSGPAPLQRWKRRLPWLTIMALVVVTGFALVTPAYAQTGLAKAVATMHAIGLDEPSDLGMIAIGVVGVILGRQSGLFMSRHRDKHAG